MPATLTPQKTTAVAPPVPEARTSDAHLTALQEQISVRKGLIGCGNTFTVAVHKSGTVSHAGDNRWGQQNCTEWTHILSVACGPDFVLGLRTDGTVLSAGRNTWGQLDTHRLFCIRAIACGLRHAAAITQNGQVLCLGDNTHGQCNTQQFKNIVDLCCGDTFTVGLTSRGTLCVAGGSFALRRTVSGWRRIVAVFADQSRRAVYAIDANGHLLCSKPLPAYTVSWRNLVYVSAAGKAVCGITSDGTLLSDRKHRALRKSADTTSAEAVSGEADGFVSCEQGHRFLVALRQDGRVTGIGQNDLGQINTSDFVPCFTDYSTHFAQRQSRYRHQEDTNRHYQTRLTLSNRFVQWLACGEHLTAALHISGRVMTTAKLRDVKSWDTACQIRCGNAHLLALHTDGTVSAAGNDVDGCCQVSHWKNVTAIEAGRYHSIGLTSDGKLLFAGQNQNGQGDVTDWTRIRAVYGNEYFTVGLTWDGSLITTRIRETTSALTPDEIQYWNYCLSEIETSPLWQNITFVAVSDRHVAALRRDGAVVTLGNAAYRASIPRGTEALSVELPWPQVRAIAAGSGYTVGLCYGGTVVSCGLNLHGQCNTQNWAQVVAIDCGYSHTVGLCADGRVLSCGMQQVEPSHVGAHHADGYAPCQTSDWQDVLAIRCGTHHTVAVTRTGHMFACGQYANGQCDVSSMVLFHDIDKVNQKGSRRHTVATTEPATADRSDLHTSHGSTDDAMPYQVQNSISLQGLRADSESYRSRIAGSSHHVSVLTDQECVVSLDLDTNTVLTDVAYGSPICAISAGADHTAMLTRGGHVRIRSTFRTGSLTVPVLEPDTKDTVTAIASGTSYTALLMQNGRVRLFNIGLPLPMSTDIWENVTAIVSGEHHLAALTSDGRVRATGYHPSDTPTEASRAWETDNWMDMVSVACSSHATVGINRNGTLRIVGQAFDATTETITSSTARRVVATTSSGQHLVALYDDGRVRAIGSNQFGECDTQAWEQIIMVATRPGVTFGLRADGCVMTAGQCEFAAHRLRSIRALFSFGTTLVFLSATGDILIQREGSQKEPVLVRSLSMFTPDTSHYNVLNRLNKEADPAALARSLRVRIARGLSHAVYLDENGFVQTVGSNHYGQRQTHGWPSALSVSCGLYHTAALLRDGRIRLCGKQNGEDIDTDAFNAFLSGATDTTEDTANRSRFVSVSCGYHHTAAIRADGLVFAVGDNRYGQCAVQKFQNAIDLSCGVRHTAVLLEDGRVRVVGDNRYGQCNTEDWSDVIMTACGEFHTVGLKKDGTLVATGSDTGGQCSLSDLNDVISVACLAEATVCVRADGSVIIRGNHHIPEETVSRLREIVAVRCCEYRLMALCADGRILFHPQT